MFKIERKKKNKQNFEWSRVRQDMMLVSGSQPKIEEETNKTGGVGVNRNDVTPISVESRTWMLGRGGELSVLISKYRFGKEMSRFIQSRITVEIWGCCNERF